MIIQDKAKSIALPAHHNRWRGNTKRRIVKQKRGGITIPVIA